MTTPAPLPTLVTTDTFKLWPGVIVGDDETASADYLLLAASNYVRIESDDPNRWADPTADPAPPAVLTVVVQVAARVWRNPDNAAMVTTGPFAEQWTQAVEDGLHLTDSERKILARTTARSPLWTQSTTRDDDVLPSPYIFDWFSGEQIPRAPYPADEWLFGSPR